MSLFHKRIRMMGDVPRWVIVRTIQQQSVAEHSYFVALYTMELIDFFDFPHPLEALSYALLHDLPEVLTGDVPSIARRKMTKQDRRDEVHDMRDHFDVDISAAENTRHLVKVADMMEAIQFLSIERELGNNANKRLREDVNANMLKAWSRMDAEQGKWDEWVEKYGPILL